MNIITREDIVQALKLIIQEKDKYILVHSNIFSFGKMENPIEDIMSAFMKSVLPHQTLIMPAFTFSFCKSGYYHYTETQSETGILTEHFRNLPGVKRTQCPINSFCAYGCDADYLASQGMSSTCWGEDSIYRALIEKNALVLGFGEPLNLRGSVFHYAEEQAKVPYRYFKTFPGNADFGHGLEQIEKKMFVRRLDLPVEYDYMPAIEQLKKEGKYKKTALGGSFIEAIHAKDAVEVLVDILRNDPLAVLSTRSEYEMALNQRSFTFLGSTNLDLMARIFSDEYRDVTRKECRIVTVPFDQYRQQILNPESNLRIADPDYVIFLERIEEVLGETLRFPKAVVKNDEIEELVKEKVFNYIDFIKQARKLLRGVLIISNFEPIVFSPLGNADGFIDGGTRQLVEIANIILKDQTKEMRDTVIMDYHSLLKRCGVRGVFNEKLWFMGRIAFGNEFSKMLSRKITGLSLAKEGNTVRLVVVDLDNTLWGGVVGDDGLEGIQLGGDYPGNIFKDFQVYLKGLSMRGIALAVSSKNNEETALEAIRKHPEMVLRESDFAGLRINWEDKPSQILSICESLKLGTYSVLFLDDNPVERELVRKNFPDCIVPELPVNPSEWIRYLSEHPYLECISITAEDLKRSRAYAKKGEESRIRDSFSNVDDFLAAADMHLFIERHNQTNSARILQLIAKTNQFNTTTRRHTQGDLDVLENEHKAEVYGIAFQDRIYEKEIIGVIIVIPDREDAAAILVDSFILSCRVLGRNIETAVLGWLCQTLLEKGVKRLRGEIFPTSKNHPVQPLFSRHGFKQVSEYGYELNLEEKTINVPSYFKVTQP